MEPQLKENVKTPMLDKQEDPSLNRVKIALRALNAAKDRKTVNAAKHQEEVDRAERNYRLEIECYNREHLKPRVIKSHEDWHTYIETLSHSDIYRSCFVKHEGEPKSFPSVVVSIRDICASYDHTYHHRFLSSDEMESLMIELRC